MIGEAAHSQNDSDLLGAIKGDAYRLELTRLGANGGSERVRPGVGLGATRGRLYYQAADTGFVNNATISFTPGQERWGAQFAVPATATTGVRFQYDEERNHGVAPRPLTALDDLLSAQTSPLSGSRTDNLLRSISAGIQQRWGPPS